MWPVLALVLALPAMPLAARVHTRVHLSRAAVRMIDEDTPTSYADYMKKKQGSELSEKLEKGEVVFDANSDWQRTEGEGGKSTMSQGFASTDTPDFLPEEGDPRADIDFQQGMMGSQKAKQEHDHDPGVSAALEVNPEVVAGVEIDGNRRVEFVVPEERWPGDPAAQLAAEFDLGPTSHIGKHFQFDVEPVCMTFEDYYAGWTAGSDPAFKVEPPFGRMDKKGGAVSTFTVHCEPSGPERDIEGYMCIILPDDGEQWTFKFTAHCTGS